MSGGQTMAVPTELLTVLLDTATREVKLAADKITYTPEENWQEFETAMMAMRRAIDAKEALDSPSVMNVELVAYLASVAVAWEASEDSKPPSTRDECDEQEARLLTTRKLIAISDAHAGTLA